MFSRVLTNLKLPTCVAMLALILSACGGGSAGGSANVANVNNPVETPTLSAKPAGTPLTSSDVQSATDASSTPQTVASSSSPSFADTQTSENSEDTDSVIVPASPVIIVNSGNGIQRNPSGNIAKNPTPTANAVTSTSSKISSISSSVSSIASSAARISASSVSSRSSTASSASTVGATIEWAHPISRANGSYLNLDEIGGYDIRYKTAASSTYTHIDISGNWTTSYFFPTSLLGLTFEIAVYDTDGIYSDYTAIN